MKTGSRCARLEQFKKIKTALFSSLTPESQQSKQLCPSKAKTWHGQKQPLFTHSRRGYPRHFSSRPSALPASAHVPTPRPQLHRPIRKAPRFPSETPPLPSHCPLHHSDPPHLTARFPSEIPPPSHCPLPLRDPPHLTARFPSETPPPSPISLPASPQRPPLPHLTARFPSETPPPPSHCPLHHSDPPPSHCPLHHSDPPPSHCPLPLRDPPHLTARFPSETTPPSHCPLPLRDHPSISLPASPQRPPPRPSHCPLHHSDPPPHLTARFTTVTPPISLPASPQ